MAKEVTSQYGLDAVEVFAQRSVGVLEIGPDGEPAVPAVFALIGRDIDVSDPTPTGYTFTIGPYRWQIDVNCYKS